MQALSINQALPQQAEQISQLIFKLAHFFTKPQSAEDLAPWFSESISPAAILACINDPRIHYLVASIEEQLAGVIAVKDNTHIQHLFVAQEFQRKGVASALWRRAKSHAIAAGNSKGFSVRSSEFAVPIYQHLGFEIVDEKQYKDGIAYIPMQLRLNNKD